MPPIEIPALKDYSPGALDTFLLVIEGLQIPRKARQDINFLASLLLACISTLSDRVPDIQSEKYAANFISQAKRQQILDIVPRIRVADVLIFGRLGQLGLPLNAVQLLSGVVGMHHRYSGGEGSDVIQDWTEQAFQSMSVKELYLVYEYMHALLSYLTSGAHPELHQLQSSHQDLAERKRGFTHKDGMLVIELNKSKKAMDDIESFFGKAGKETSTAGAGSPGGAVASASAGSKTGKSKKKPVLLFRQGI